MKKLLPFLLLIPFANAQQSTDPFANPPSSTPISADPFATHIDQLNPATNQNGNPTVGADPFAAQNSSRASSRPPPKEFRLSNVGHAGANETRDKLLELFDKVQLQFTVDEKGHLATKPSLINAGTLQGKVLQMIGSKEALISPTSVSIGDSFPELVHVDFNGDQNLVDGSHIVILVQPDENYSYTTVLGARKTVRSYREAGWEPAPTQTQFTAAIRAKQSVIVTLLEPKHERPPGALLGTNDIIVNEPVDYKILW